MKMDWKIFLKLRENGKIFDKKRKSEKIFVLESKFFFIKWKKINEKTTKYLVIGRDFVPNTVWKTNYQN